MCIYRDSLRIKASFHKTGGPCAALGCTGIVRWAFRGRVRVVGKITVSKGLGIRILGFPKKGVFQDSEVIRING